MKKMDDSHENVQEAGVFAGKKYVLEKRVCLWGKKVCAEKKECVYGEKSMCWKKNVCGKK